MRKSCLVQRGKTTTKYKGDSEALRGGQTDRSTEGKRETKAHKVYDIRQIVYRSLNSGKVEPVQNYNLINVITKRYFNNYNLIFKKHGIPRVIPKRKYDFPKF